MCLCNIAFFIDVNKTLVHFHLLLISSFSLNDSPLPNKHNSSENIVLLEFSLAEIPRVLLGILDIRSYSKLIWFSLKFRGLTRACKHRIIGRELGNKNKKLHINCCRMIGVHKTSTLLEIITLQIFKEIIKEPCVVGY